MLQLIIRWLQRRSDSTLALLTRLLFSRSWRKFLEAVHDPRAAQEARLLEILVRNADTVFGREHDFARIDSIEAYQAKVPIRDYDAHEPYISRMVKGEADVLVKGQPFFFARTSGTTGSAKFIPITKEYIAEYRTPRRIWMRQVMQAFPGLVKGKVLGVHSPKIEGRTETGTPYGSVTVAFNGSPGEKAMPARELGFDPSPPTAFLLEDFEQKYYVILRMAAQEDLSLIGTINPSTTVLLAKKLDEYADRLGRDLEQGTLEGLESIPEPMRTDIELRLRAEPEMAERIRASKAEHGFVRPVDLWPNVRGLLCWKGGSAPFYLSQLERLFPGRKMMDFGFVATEGGMSIPLSPEGARGVVAVTGHFLEFVPEDVRAAGGDSPALLADALEVGEEYRVLITGSHGLYRYDINDVVRCVGRYANTAEVEFVHKGGNMLSITGEKLGESHVVNAFDAATASTGIALAGFCVSVELRDPPRYIFGVEPRDTLDEATLRRLRESAEQALCEANMEYAAKRSSLRLGPPVLKVLRPGAFERYRKARVEAGAPDGHVKPPHLVRDPKRIDDFGVTAEYEA